MNVSRSHILITLCRITEIQMTSFRIQIPGTDISTISTRLEEYDYLKYELNY